MKTKQIYGFSCGVIIALVMIFASCSRAPDNTPTKPLLMPPTAMWPSNVLFAAEVIRTSGMNKEREMASAEIGRFIQACLTQNTPERSQRQPVQKEAILKMFGPPCDDPHFYDERLCYRIGHYYNTGSFIMFEITNGIVVGFSGFTTSTGFCKLHDHTNDRIDRKQDTEPKHEGDGKPAP